MKNVKEMENKIYDTTCLTWLDFSAELFSELFSSGIFKNITEISCRVSEVWKVKAIAEDENGYIRQSKNLKEYLNRLKEWVSDQENNKFILCPLINGYNDFDNKVLDIECIIETSAKNSTLTEYDKEKK